MQEHHKTGTVAKYASTCWMKLMEEDSAGSDSESSSDASTGDDEDREGTVEASASYSLGSFASLENYYDEEVNVTEAGRAKIEERTWHQSSSPIWHKERRKRITSTMVKAIAGRRSENFVPLLPQKLRASFAGNTATRYGQNHEGDALKLFSFLVKDYGNLRMSGLVIDSGLLCRQTHSLTNLMVRWLSDALVDKPDGEVVVRRTR